MRNEYGEEKRVLNNRIIQLQEQLHEQRWNQGEKERLEIQNQYKKEKELRRLLACEKLEKERQSSQCREQIISSERKLKTVRHLHAGQLKTVCNQHSQHETNMIDQWEKQHDEVCRKHVEHIDQLWGTIEKKKKEISNQKEQHEQELQRLRQDLEEYKKDARQQFNQMKELFDNVKL